MIKSFTNYSTNDAQVNIPLLVRRDIPVSLIYTPSGVYIQADYLPDDNVFAQSMHIRTETVPALPAQIGKNNRYIAKKVKQNNLSNTVMAVSKPLNTPLPLCDAAVLFNVTFTFTFSIRDNEKVLSFYEFKSHRGLSDMDKSFLQNMADSISSYEVSIKAEYDDLHNIEYAVSYLNSCLGDEVFALSMHKQPFPVLPNETRNISSLHSENVAFTAFHTDAFLFSSAPLANKEKTTVVAFGTDIYGKSTYIALSDLKNSSTSIQGPSGYGKTNLIKYLVSEIQKQDKDAVIITIDPVKTDELKTNGKVYTIGSEKDGLKLNLFSLDKGEIPAKKISDFLDNASYILQADALLANIVKNAIYGLYKANKPVTFELIKASAKAYLKRSTYKPDIASHLSAMVSLRLGSIIASGADSLFTVEDDTLFSLCFEKGSVTHLQFSSQLDTILKNLYLSLLFSKIKNKILSMREKGHYNHVYLVIDEMSDIADDTCTEIYYGNCLSQQINDYIKRLRYIGVSFILADQNKLQCFNNCSNSIIFKQLTDEYNIILSDRQKYAAARLPRYQCILSCATMPQPQYVFEINIYKED